MAREWLSVSERRRWMTRAVATRRRFLDGATLYVRMVLGITAALCLALLAGTLNEAHVAAGLRAQAGQTASANARLRADITTTMRLALAAESDATIVREAHQMGYFLPGEPWVVTVPAQP